MNIEKVLNLISTNLGIDLVESKERYEYLELRISSLPLDVMEILYRIINENNWTNYREYIDEKAINNLEQYYKDEPRIDNCFDYIVAIINGLELTMYKKKRA